MFDEKLASVCGLYCGTCEYLGVKCSGCGHIQGKPFWAPEMNVEVCPLFDCCVNKKQLEHCGLCDEFPCKMFMGFYDPSLSPEEAEKSINDRRDALLRRRDIGTKKWLEGFKE